MKALGFRQFRVRFHGDVVRLEIAREELPVPCLPDTSTSSPAIFKPLGFHYVTLDVEGYRQGSLNAGLKTASESLFARPPSVPLTLPRSMPDPGPRQYRPRLQADREPNQIRRDAGGCLFVRRKLLVGCRGGMNHQTASVAHIRQMRENLQVIDEPPAAFESALHAKENTAPAPFGVYFCAS